MTRDPTGFFDAELHAMILGLTCYIRSLEALLRTEAETLAIRAATEELKMARRARRKLKRIVGVAEATPHADRLIRSLPREWGIKR